MINLIKAEIKKIFHKKSFYIVTLIFVLYCILTNVLYKNIDNLLNLDFMFDLTVEELENENKSLDLKNSDDALIYVENISTIEMLNLQKEMNNNTADYLIDNFLYDLIYEANVYKYIGEDEDAYQMQREEIDEHIKRIKEGNWQYYANLKIKNYQAEIDNSDDEETKERYQELKQLEEYRINNNVAYDSDNYLHNAIDEIEINFMEYQNLKNKTNRIKEEDERLNQLESQMQINKYVLDNKVDVNASDTLNRVFQNFPDEFGLFILIYVIMISGSIVSEEFNKGTIKSLLTKPYKRGSILLAKLLTVVGLVPFIILFMSLIELIIGGLILGFGSLTSPVVIFNSATASLKIYNIVSYFLLIILAYWPMYLILEILCFTLSTITNSTSAAITITFLFYLAGNVISGLASLYNIKILKAFVSLNWNFRYLVDFEASPYGIKPSISIIILVIYIVVMLCLAFINFCKKDVKNI